MTVTQRRFREMEQRAHGPRPQHDAKRPFGPPPGAPMQFTPVVPARVLRHGTSRWSIPKDLVPLTGVKGRGLMFRQGSFAPRPPHDAKRPVGPQRTSSWSKARSWQGTLVAQALTIEEFDQR